MKCRLLAVSLVTLTLLWATPPVSQAKEFELDGTIDCGKPSGTLCLPVGATIGIITDQYSGKKNERVEVSMGAIIEQRLQKSRTGQLLLEDPKGYGRVALLTQLRPIVEQISHLDPESLNPKEMERLVRDLFDKGLPRETARTRDLLMVITRSFSQDSRIRVIVDDKLGPGLVVTEIMEYQDYQLSTSRSSGTVNHGRLTGMDSEQFSCTDFIEEALDFFKKRFEEEGNFDLTNNEELFFEMLSHLPSACTTSKRRTAALVGDWVRWNLEAVEDDLRKELRERTREHLRKLRALLQRPDARYRLLDLLEQSALLPQPKESRR